MDIVSFIQNMEDYVGANGVSSIEIGEYEKKLGLTFAEEYSLYLERIGLACFDGKELTGISHSSRLNVLDVTNEERTKHPQISSDWYVVEQTNIDGIVIWQDSAGCVYQIDRNGKIQNKYLSIYDYLIKTN